MATAQVLFQRFYYSKSLVKHDCEVSYNTFNVQAIGRFVVPRLYTVFLYLNFNSLSIFTKTPW